MQVRNLPGRDRRQQHSTMWQCGIIGLLCPQKLAPDPLRDWLSSHTLCQSYATILQTPIGSSGSNRRRCFHSVCNGRYSRAAALVACFRSTQQQWVCQPGPDVLRKLRLFKCECSRVLVSFENAELEIRVESRRPTAVPREARWLTLLYVMFEFVLSSSTLGDLLNNQLR